MEESSKSNKTTEVLVVGGGFAGLSAVQTIRDSLDLIHVTFVSPLDVFEFGPLMLRSLAYPTMYKHATKNLQSDDYSFIHGNVLELKKYTAKLLCHTTNKHMHVRFDFCIWACGSLYPEPITNLMLNSIIERQSMISRMRLQIQNSERLLVVGGGLRGVEMAALLSEMNSKLERDQKITMVTSSKRLLSDLPPVAGVYAAEFLSKKGVRISCEKRVQSVDPNQLCCRDIANGEKVAKYKGADFVFWAFARENRVIAAPLLRGELICEEELNKTGRIFVRKTLQLSHHNNIFVVGDCSVVVNDKSGDRAKTFFSAIEAGRLAARNILTLATDKSANDCTEDLKEYPKDAFPLGVYPKVYCISLGSNAAVAVLGPFALTGRVALFCKEILEFLALGVLGSSARIRRRLYHFALRFIYFVCAAAEKILFQSRSTTLDRAKAIRTKSIRSKVK